jgi:SEC-C motif-containing protein
MKKHRPGTDAAPCPCGSPSAYAECCGALHAGSTAPTAEALMRSRYSAYVLALEPYLLATWHSSTRPTQLDLAANEKSQWLGLEIKRRQINDDTASVEFVEFVEFVARYKTSGRAHRLHETSRFIREDGRWYYVDGEFPAKATPP